MKELDLEKEFTQMIIENRHIIFKVCYFYTTDEYTIVELSQDLYSICGAPIPVFVERANFLLGFIV